MNLGYFSPLAPKFRLAAESTRFCSRGEERLKIDLCERNLSVLRFAKSGLTGPREAKGLGTPPVVTSGVAVESSTEMVHVSARPRRNTAAALSVLARGLVRRLVYPSEVPFRATTSHRKTSRATSFGHVLGTGPRARSLSARGTVDSFGGVCPGGCAARRRAPSLCKSVVLYADMHAND